MDPTFQPETDFEPEELLDPTLAQLILAVAASAGLWVLLPLFVGA